MSAPGSGVGGGVFGGGRLVRRAGAAAVARMAAEFSQLAVGIMLAWSLSREINGFFQKGYLVARIVVPVVAFGLPTALYYFLPRLTGSARRAVVMRSVAVLGALGVVAAFAVFWAAPWLAREMDNDALVPLIRAACAVIVVSLPALAAEPLLLVAERARVWAAASLVAALVQVGGVGLLLLGGVGLEWLFAAIAAAAVVRLMPALVLAGRLYPPDGGSDEQSDSKAAAVGFGRHAMYVLPIGLAGMLDAGSLWLDRALVALRFSDADLALYNYGATEVPFIAILTASLLPVLLPEISGRLARNDREGALGLWHRAASVTSPVLFGLWFALLWVAPDFLATIYSEEYRGSALFFRIYLCMLPLRVVSYIPTLNAMNRNGAVLVGAAGELVLNVALALWLMAPERLGMAGAAWAMVIATAVQVAWYLVWIRRGFGVPWKRLLPWGRLGADMLIAGVWFLPLGAALWWMQSNPELATSLVLRKVVMLGSAGVLYLAYAAVRVLPRLRR
ncbi:hypothetical protein CVU37_10395 [candidate division BRC1 bacterium HGW-BRC1-1]|nr:MAG: hypothetical protein CVU37_10395 [candidate division BRC1 bacterium HGW-BRC1-1]